MRTIKIQFVDFFPDWNIDNNFIIRPLREKYNVEFSDDPDYLFFSCFGDKNLDYDCVKIFWTGEDITPDFNLCDYGIAFDQLDYGDRYLRYPLFCIGNRVEKTVRNRVFSQEELNEQRSFCSFVVSNANANPVRERFFHQLSEYKQVASGGRYLNNVGGPVADKIEFQSRYKFAIAFENDMSDGYTSEKILDAYQAKTIPIYWGNRRVSQDFNPDSFINCHDFDCMEDVIAYVKKIDNDPDLYKQMLTAPVFKDNTVPYRFTSAALADYLFHIIDQPIGEAKRISSFSRKRDYLSTQKEKAQLFDLAHHNTYYKVLSKLGGINKSK